MTHVLHRQSFKGVHHQVLNIKKKPQRGNQPQVQPSTLIFNF
jgi:hypothetical protein